MVLYGEHVDYGGCCVCGVTCNVVGFGNDVFCGSVVLYICCSYMCVVVWCVMMYCMHMYVNVVLCSVWYWLI